MNGLLDDMIGALTVGLVFVMAAIPVGAMVFLFLCIVKLVIFAFQWVVE